MGFFPASPSLSTILASGVPTGVTGPLLARVHASMGKLRGANNKLSWWSTLGFQQFWRLSGPQHFQHDRSLAAWEGGSES